MILFNLNNLKELLESLSSLKYYCNNKNISYEDVRIELKDNRIEINIPTKERGILIYNSHNKTLTDMSPWDMDALKNGKILATNDCEYTTFITLEKTYRNNEIF